MSDVFDQFDLVLRAFWLTIQLFLLGRLSLVIGTVLAAMRVGPVGIMRGAVSTYVAIVRNTPLLLIFVLVFVAFPRIGVNFEFLTKGVIALTFYTSTFVCEAIRSGVNSVPLGQAEAARAIGLTFGGTMREVILPQAFRATVPPLASVLIALLKNTSIAAAFGLVEATARMRYFTNNNADDRALIFLTFAIGYVILVELVSFAAGMLERRWRVASMSASVLFDSPGPKTRARHRIYSVVVVVVLVALIALVLLRLDAEGPARLRPLGAVLHPGLRAGAFEGLLKTLQMAAFSVLFSVVFGVIFGLGKLSDQAWIRWPAWLVVEFFRAVPVLLLMVFFFLSFGVGANGSARSGAWWSRSRSTTARCWPRCSGRGSTRCRPARRRRRTPSACARAR